MDSVYNLLSDDQILICPGSGWRYQEVEPGIIRCLDWPEDKSLPVNV